MPILGSFGAALRHVVIAIAPRRARPRRHAESAVQQLERRRLLSAGDLDLTFGDGGIVATDFGGENDQARAVLVQSSGKILVAGRAGGIDSDFLLARYEANGSLDAGFGGGDGFMLTDFGDGSGARAMATQADGKIVLAGYVERRTDVAAGYWDFALARYRPDGTLDPTFGGGDGIVVTDIVGGYDQAYSLAIQNDGKIVVAGSTFDMGPNAYPNDWNIVLARYNSDGSLDATFGGGDGLVITDFGTHGFEEAYSVAVQTDGRIVVAATWTNVLRYEADGDLDTTFGGGDGRVTIDFGGGGQATTTLALESYNRIVVAGSTYDSATGKTRFGLARLRADGSTDASFGGGDGIVTTDFQGLGGYAEAVTIQADGAILVAGVVSLSSQDTNFAIARYNIAGRLDRGFGGGDGIVTTDFGGNSDHARALAIQQDGKIVVAGAAGYFAGGLDAGLARYEGTGSGRPARTRVRPSRHAVRDLRPDMLRSLLHGVGGRARRGTPLSHK